MNALRPSRSLLAASALLLLAALAPPAVAQTPTGALHGEVPPQGLALVVWDGGSVDALAEAAAGRGCTLRSAWVIEDGAFLGYLASAPSAVNRAFLEKFPGGVLPEGPVILVCGSSGGGGSSSARTIEGTSCRLFPNDNPWAMRIDDLPVHPDSERYLDYIAGLGGNQFLHADFGSNPD